MVITKERSGEFDIRRQFPKFQWLLRDVILPPVDENGDPLPLTDYIKNEVLLREASSQSQAQGVVKALLELFPSFECHMLPIPSTKRDVLNTITENESKLTAEFNEAVTELRVNLLNDLQPKQTMTSDQHCVNGSLLSTLVGECLHSLSTPDIIPNLSFSWQIAMSNRLDTVLNNLVDDYQEELEQALQNKGALEESVPVNYESPNPLEESLDIIPEEGGEIQVLEMDVPISPEPARSVYSPTQRTPRRPSIARSTVSSTISLVQVTPPRTLIGIHQSILDSKLQEFRREINRCMGVISEEKKSELLLRLERQIVEYDKTPDGNCTGHVVGGILLKYIQENHKKSKERCSQMFERIVEPLKTNLTRVVDCIRDNYYTMAVGPAKDEIFATKMSEFEELASRLPPGSPRSLRVVGQAQDKLKVRWRRPNLHPRAVKGYEVQIMKQAKQHTRGEWMTVISSTRKRAAIVTDLTASTTYLFRVRGRNTNQIGEWSEEIETITLMGQAGRYGASAAGFVGGSLTAPFVLTAETFKEGLQVYRESETRKEKVLAGFGIMVSGLMFPVILSSESLLTTSTGVEVAESVYKSTGTTEEDDFDETNAEVVSILPDISSSSSYSYSSDQNDSVMPAIVQQSYQQQQQQQQQEQEQPTNLESKTIKTNNTTAESETTALLSKTTVGNKQNGIVTYGDQCPVKHHQLRVDLDEVTKESRRLQQDTDDGQSHLRQRTSTGGSSRDCSLEGSINVHMQPVVNSQLYDSPSPENDSFSVLHSFAFTDQH